MLSVVWSLLWIYAICHYRHGITLFFIAGFLPIAYVQKDLGVTLVWLAMTVCILVPVAEYMYPLFPDRDELEVLTGDLKSVSAEHGRMELLLGVGATEHVLLLPQRSPAAKRVRQIVTPMRVSAFVWIRDQSLSERVLWHLAGSRGVVVRYDEEVGAAVDLRWIARIGGISLAAALLLVMVRRTCHLASGQARGIGWRSQK